MEKRIDKEKIILILLLSTFAIVAVLFAFKVRMGISPDSFYHLDVSKAYSTTLGIPENTPDTFKYRDITRITYLYFWINGRILNINNEVINEVILLRLVNVIYSLATVFVLYLLSKEVLKKKLERILPVFFLTNTLMFLFLSSSINYDNLANLLCILAIYLFIKFVKSKLDTKYLLWMIVIICLGGLTKFTTLPLAFILIVLSVVNILRKRELFKSIKLGKSILLFIPILLLGFLNIELYATNLFKYGGLEPNCERILTHEQCLQNGVYYRDNVTFPKTEIDGFPGIVELIKSGDRIDPVSYFFKWIPNFTMKIYGIMGDSSLFMKDIFTYMFLFYFFVALIFGLINFKKWKRLDIYLILIFVFYLLTLFLFQNYDMYLKYNHFYLGLQGRYIFPVISIMYILLSKSLFCIKQKWLRYIILVPLLLLFIYSCTPFFFANVENWWLTGTIN